MVDFVDAALIAVAVVAVAALAAALLFMRKKGPSTAPVRGVGALKHPLQH